MCEQTSTLCTHYSLLQAASHLNFLSHYCGSSGVQEVLYFIGKNSFFTWVMEADIIHTVTYYMADAHIYSHRNCTKFDD
jgi:hypothetical protein